jgi:4-hydroxy-3-polyprenylbenzoate decarboxylase
VRTLNAELGAQARDIESGLETLLGDLAGDRKVILHTPDAMEGSISSGSFPVDGMVVVPCSGGTLAAIANGTSTNLLQRAAEVTLKEHRPLILAFRETPLSLVHIENMRRAALAGAILYPLMPAFYTGPQSIDDIVVQFTARLFDLLHLPHALGRRWGGGR